MQSLNITFSEPIDPATFDYHDLALTLNGGGNLITSDVTVTPVNSTTWQRGNINWVQGYAGTYSFTVDAAGILDLAGNPGTGSTNETWQLILETPSTSANLAIAPDLGISPTDGLTSTNTITLSGTVGAINLTVRVFDQASSTDLGTATVLGTNFSKSLIFTIEGAHHLQVIAVDAAGNVSSPATYSLFLDVIPPTALIQPVTNPIYSAVSTIPVVFSEPINTNTIAAADFGLTINGTNTFTPTLTYTWRLTSVGPT